MITFAFVSLALSLNIFKIKSISLYDYSTNIVYIIIMKSKIFVII